MNNQQQMAMAFDAYNKIFASKALNTDITQITVATDVQPFAYRGRWFVNRTLRGFDVAFLYNGQIASVRMLEQNPAKMSDYGRMARAGAKIMWVISLKNNKFLFRIQDGQVIKNEERAVYPANSTAGLSVSKPQVRVDEIPEIDESIAEYVQHTVPEDFEDEIDIPYPDRETY
jgi:hypothetical protein